MLKDLCEISRESELSVDFLGLFLGIHFRPLGSLWFGARFAVVELTALLFAEIVAAWQFLRSSRPLPPPSCGGPGGRERIEICPLQPRRLVRGFLLPSSRRGITDEEENATVSVILPNRELPGKASRA